MKLAGSQLVFGKGCLEYLKQIPSKRAMVVIGGKSMEHSGFLAKVENYLHEEGAATDVFRNVEPDPSFSTVLAGRKAMLAFKPDLIVALGGGSVMDAAKGMWIYYEHPELKSLDDIQSPNQFPLLRTKARLVCIPSTAGTASEVSRSIVITEGNLKHGIGNMEMMPDIAICDPYVTESLPASITANTGLDALTHALEALVSNRANYVSSILATQAAIDIIHALPVAYKNGHDMDAREQMLNASMVAGLAFTNVSLGIVHSMAHTIGSYFSVAHGLADAIILPYIIHFNSKNPRAKNIYEDFLTRLGVDGKLEDVVKNLNKHLGIPATLGEIINNRPAFDEKLEEMAECALADGCTKTNPIIPTSDQFKQLFKLVYAGEQE